MVSIFDVEADKLIGKTKEELKKIDKIKPPEWSKFVKTGVSREKTPQQEDFWYIRAAAILRQLYKMGKPTGVQRLRTKYGGKQKNTTKPDHFVKGSGKIIRNIIQQLEEAGFVKKTTINDKKGRTLTKKGTSFLDKIAASIAKESS
jgi:small subunit ribosomal protein S19e